MKKTLVLSLIILFVLGSFTGCASNITPVASTETPNAPRKAPSLDVSLTTGNMPDQRVQAAQLTTSWMIVDENGNGNGYEADSPHPLQLSDYKGITLGLDDAGGEIELLFGDNYPPEYVSAQRWDAIHAGMESTDSWDKGEPVEFEGGKFQITSDGHDYIYAVSAKWGEGNSSYAFRIESSSMPLDEQLPLMLIQSIAPNSISFVFENSTDMGFTYGEDYSLYIHENNKWEPVNPIIDNWGFNSIGYMLEPICLNEQQIR
jgi:hypothetical protein